MRILYAIMLVVLLLICGQATAKQLVIFTGSSQGTYYRFAEDIQKVCKGLDIKIVTSRGSLDNLNNLLRDPTGEQRFALIQSDVLSTVTSSVESPITIKRVMSMYREDVTVLVNKKAKIKTLADLSGKRVATGEVGSGTWFTASAIRSKLGIDWAPLERSPEESVLSLIVGDVDAMFIVGGHPLKLLTVLGGSVKDTIEILNINQNFRYAKSKLPAYTYPWQPHEVNLRTVQSSLIAAPDVPANTIARLTSCISNAMPELKKSGHPKWRDVRIQLKK